MEQELWVYDGFINYNSVDFNAKVVTLYLDLYPD